MLNAFGAALWSRFPFRRPARRHTHEQATLSERDDNGRPGSQRPRGEPPDLDEVLQDFKRRLNNLFGGRKFGTNGGGNRFGGGAGGPQGPGVKGAGIGAGVIVAAIVLLWLGSGFFIVQEGQAGVVLQFGKYKHTAGAGFQWRLPYPIQSHEVVDVSKVRTVEIGYRENVKSKVARESLMLTDDENIIDIQLAVQYRLQNPTEFLFNNLYLSRGAEDMVMQVAETAVREIVGKSKMDYVLYEGREQVAIEVSQLMQGILEYYKSGITVNSVTIQNAQPPEQVQAAFDDAVKAVQDRDRQKNEGQAYANDVIPRARGNASRLLEEAEGYRQRVVAQAEGDTSRFKQILAEYSKAPVVTRDRLYLETMQQIFTNTAKVMIDSKANGNLLYLPLDKLIQQSGQDPKGAANAPSSSPATTLPLLNELDPRSRDSLRSREREVR